ncbi:MAG: Ig-like domain-containing protein [Verrucomicrobiales bacterium]
MKPIHLLIAIGGVLLSLTQSPAQTFELPWDWKFDPGSEDAEAPGFIGKLHQARKNSGLTATIARGNAQLAGALLDPGTGEAYENLAVMLGDPIIDAGWAGTMPLEAGGEFILPGVVNFSTDADGFLVHSGNFTAGTGYPEEFFPGLPGADSGAKDIFSNGQNFAVELVAWLDLSEGETVLGVHHDDAVEIALHPNDARDIFRQRVVGFDSNSGAADRTVTLNVAEAGLYSVRVLMAQWNGAAMLEFYSAPGANPAQIVLVNDAGAVDPVAAWAGLSAPARPYIISVSPASNSSGVAPNTGIKIEMAEAESGTQVMRVNGAEVTPMKETTDGVTTLSYTPPVPFDPSSTVSVELDYGVATAAWSFNTVTGRKALLITGGGGLTANDGWISNRLSQGFGFDVTVVTDDDAVLGDAADADLVFNSSTVNSGKVAGVELETLAVPLINAESANTDDFLMLDVPHGGFGNNNNTITPVDITDNSHPITAGLALGNLDIFSPGNPQSHYGRVPVNGTLLAAMPGNAEQGFLYVIEEGGEVATDGGPFIHPARRVFFGLGNEGASSLNAPGVELFDRVIDWALAKPVPEQQPEITVAERDPETGDFILSWKSIPGRFYIIEVNSQLGGVWGDLNDNYLADSEVSTFIDTDDGKGDRRYYRIRLLPLAE